MLLVILFDRHAHSSGSEVQSSRSENSQAQSSQSESSGSVNSRSENSQPESSRPGSSQAAESAVESRPAAQQEIKTGKETTGTSSELELLSRQLYHNCKGKEEPIELYVMKLLRRSIDPSYEQETLMAQAVILRSLLHSRSRDGKQADAGALEEVTDAQIRDRMGENYEVYMTNILQAVLKTQGIVMKKNGEIVSMSYHAMSSGATRTMPDTGQKGVDCSDNLTAEKFLSSVVISEEKIGKLEEVQRDPQGYIEWIKCDGEWVSGEKFRLEHGLLSADFSWEKKKMKYYFTVRGIGHGYGFDQYHANEMAKEGNDFKEILLYFDPEISFERIE